jgi:hypothetical protein
MPPAPPDPDASKPLDWKAGLDLANLEDWQILNTFANLRTSKDPKLGLKGWIRANPTWDEQCSDQVRKKIRKKWKNLYKEESLEAFMVELGQDVWREGSDPNGRTHFQPMTVEQNAQMAEWIEAGKIPTEKLYGWAVHAGHAKSFGEAGARISKEGAEYILANKAIVIQDMVQFYKDKDE